MSVRYASGFFMVFVFSYLNSSEVRHDDIVVHNQTHETIYLSIYNVGEVASPIGLVGSGSRKIPLKLDARSQVILQRPELNKISRFKYEKQKLVLSLYSAFLGYTMSPEGLCCFPSFSMSGFRNKRRKRFNVTREILTSQQFGRLTMDSYRDDNIQGDCYRLLNEAIEEARTH